MWCNYGCYIQNNAGHPLNEGELRVLKGTHETDPIRLRGGEVGSEKTYKFLESDQIVGYSNRKKFGN